MKLYLNGISLFVFYCSANRKRNLAIRSRTTEPGVVRTAADSISLRYRLGHHRFHGTRVLRAKTENDDTEDDEPISNGSFSKDHVFDVIIVGAGWAGLAAGKHQFSHKTMKTRVVSDLCVRVRVRLPLIIANLLAKRGIDNIRILEAKGHIGGRACTTHHHFGENQNVPLDMGAMWIHGASKNVLNRLALGYNAETRTSTYTTRIYKEDNQGFFDEDTVEKYRDQFYYDGFFPFQEARQESTECDEPLKKSADLFVDQLESPSEKQLASLFLRSAIEIEYSGLLQDHSLWWWNDDFDIGGTIESDDYFLPQGHASLIGPFASQLLSEQKIKLQAPVTTIDYRTKDLIAVVYNTTKTSKDGSGSTAVVAKTRKVIVTVPLGVLKAESIAFVPKLPRWTKRSIRRLGMGKLNKVFLFWSQDDMFWPYDTEVLEDITLRDSHFLFCNPRQYNGDVPMLFAFFQGKATDQLEEEYAESDPAMYQDRIRDLAMESLRSMFGPEIPLPEKVVVTQWNVDEYTMGAYSFNQVGMGRHDRHLLAQPIGHNQIFIAGEATHSRFFATTTGAFLTGRAAARKAIKALKKS